MHTFGESQVRTAGATDTCSGLDALLMQSLFAGVSGRDALPPAGRQQRVRWVSLAVARQELLVFISAVADL